MLSLSVQFWRILVIAQKKLKKCFVVLEGRNNCFSKNMIKDLPLKNFLPKQFALKTFRFQLLDA